MINPTEVIEMTTTVYVSQFVYGVSKYYNSDFYVTTRSLKSIYLSKYTGKGYIYVTNPFKVVIL